MEQGLVDLACYSAMFVGAALLPLTAIIFGF